MQPRSLNLHEVVANLSRMLSRLLGETIALRCGLCARTTADLR